RRRTRSESSRSWLVYTAAVKVTDVRVRYYEYRMQRKLADVNDPVGTDQGVGAFTFVDTDEGITGVAPLASGAIGRLAHLIVGEDPRGVVGHRKRMMDHVFKGGNAGADKAAIMSLDVALWDLK